MLFLSFIGYSSKFFSAAWFGPRTRQPGRAWMEAPVWKGCGTGEGGGTEEPSQVWQKGEQWWGAEHHTGSLQAEGTVVAESTIHWKRMVEIHWEAAFISTIGQTTPDKSTSNISLENRKLLLTCSRISVEENYFKTCQYCLLGHDFYPPKIQLSIFIAVEWWNTCLHVFHFSWAPWWGSKGMSLWYTDPSYSWR